MGERPSAHLTIATPCHPVFVYPIHFLTVYAILTNVILLPFSGTDQLINVNGLESMFSCYVANRYLA